MWVSWGALNVVTRVLTGERQRALKGHRGDPMKTEQTEMRPPELEGPWVLSGSFPSTPC